MLWRWIIDWTRSYATSSLPVKNSCFSIIVEMPADSPGFRTHRWIWPRHPTLTEGPSVICASSVLLIARPTTREAGTARLHYPEERECSRNAQIPTAERHSIAAKVNWFGCVSPHWIISLLRISIAWGIFGSAEAAQSFMCSSISGERP
jgi:hypothetical protein